MGWVCFSVFVSTSFLGFGDKGGSMTKIESDLLRDLTLAVKELLGQTQTGEWMLHTNRLLGDLERLTHPEFTASVSVGADVPGGGAV